MSERFASGGYIPGPALPVEIRYIREVEPGLHVVSISGGRPEYLMSRDWMKRNPGMYLVGDPLTAPEHGDPLTPPEQSPDSTCG